MTDLFTCPNCGADVRVGSSSCPSCGSDDETGWSHDTLYDGLDLPESLDDSLNFEKKKNVNRAVTWCFSFLLLVIFIFSFVFRG